MRSELMPYHAKIFKLQEYQKKRINKWTESASQCVGSRLGPFVYPFFRPPSKIGRASCRERV